jgi:D-3-phosphoglycerate dehydrogenase
MLSKYEDRLNMKIVKPKVLLLEQIHQDGVRVLRQFADPKLAQNASEPAVLGELKEVNGIITRLAKVTSTMIDAAPKLRVIARHGVGYDNIDVGHATRRGIPVVFAPEAISLSVVEFTVGMILAVNRKMTNADAAARSGDWTKRYHELVGTDLQGKTIGLVGLGRIGTGVARRLKAFQVNLTYYDVVPNPELERELGIRLVSLETLLRESDIITLHAPLTERTRHMIGRREINLMKQTAILVNTSRGPVLDEEALIEAVREQRIAGAALDVYETEPLQTTNSLVQLQNVFLSPHMSGHTVEALRATAIQVAEEVKAVLSGQRPHYTANPEVLDP